MSPATLVLLSELLDKVTIPVGHPDFEATALSLIEAKKELGRAIADAQAQGPA